jgi:hypothetical protein
MATAYERAHWSAVNVMARMFGILALIVGLGFLAWGVYFAISPEAQGHITPDGSDASILNSTLGIFAVAMSVAFLRVRPYRPDLGDSIRSSRAGRAEACDKRPRNWWTGAPLA